MSEEKVKQKTGPKARVKNPCKYCKQEVKRTAHGNVCDDCHNDWKRREKYDPVGQLYSLFLYGKRMV